MSKHKGPSLGNQPDITAGRQEIASTSPSFDATKPINASTWKKTEALRIKGGLNTASEFEADRMTADFDQGLVAAPLGTPRNGIYHTQSKLFIGEWFDKKLDGSPGIVHGADFIHIVNKLVKQVTSSEIDSIEEIRFTGVVENEVDIFVSTIEGALDQDTIKPVMTAKVHMENGQTVTVVAFDRPGDKITKRSASNTFVQHLCVKPLTEKAAAIKWAQQTDKDFKPQETFEVELNPLPENQRRAFTEFYIKNPVGLTASTALDIVITATQVLAALGEKAGGIPELNSLGGGFSSTTLPHIRELITGCKLRLTPQKDNVKRRKTAEFWPIEFTFLNSKNNQDIGHGIFTWINRLDKN